MRPLRRKTEWRSERVNEVPCVIIDVEHDVPAHYERLVTILVPSSPIVEIGLDQAPSSIAGRGLCWPAAPTDKCIPLRIRADQFIAARATERMVDLAVIIEYLGPHPEG